MEGGRRREGVHVRGMEVREGCACVRGEGGCERWMEGGRDLHDPVM